ncbi:sensor histidine kinase [Nocardia seriolae]|uniref:sensor histidine kinase n=1 Tax=Nocardia seriolae TaxID=37332 RepID=UPI00068F3360|nr:histidine kinase [Nocardia seriolae]MTJ63510.1 sensor histidine kinase [Nocardia seriolae]MTJ73987.1 sensor histidine kinase [Nocardia seriolae]MTJ88529.1 sensor histidine kinase [Nocardia seriolae]MTK32513.1 sensor histidine kinase [Nocardia seriolae]MTK41409.1 sensor histidine kinase [Nocardia seriolae]
MNADGTGSLARHRLRQLIFALLIGNSVLIGLNLAAAWWRPTVWVFSMLGLLMLETLVFGVALRSSARDPLERPVAIISVVIWSGAMIASWLSPFTLPIHVVAVLIPAISAVPYVPRHHLPRYFLATLVSAFVCAALALPLIASVSAPTPVKYLATLGLPAVTTPILLVVWHTAATMRDMTVIARRNADALRSSQRLLAERADQLTSSRARLVAATDAERRRLEQDLHDGAQQHLVAIAVTLGLARQTADSDPGTCAELIGEAGELLQTAIAEIRRLAQGIYPPLLARDGLLAALPAAAARATVPVRVRVDRVGRYRPDIETALYYCCLEAIQNSAKHGGPGTAVTIAANQYGSTLLLTITDTGCGFDSATATEGSGLTNMKDRRSVIGGTLTVDSAPGMGTRLTAAVATRPLPVS